MLGCLRKKSGTSVLLSAAAVMVVSTGLHAQTITGSVSGTVTDASGAVVKGATVTAVSAGTNAKSTAVTNDDGIYALRFLQIGQYKLVVSAPGFAPYAVGPVTVETNQQLKLDAAMRLDGVAASVDVKAQLVPILNAENGTVNQVVDAQTIDNIPINGRNFTQLTQFMPGIALTNQNQWNGATGDPNNSGVRQQSVATAPSVNGNRLTSNNYTLDGIQFFDTGANLSFAFGLPGYNPAPEAIDQVTVVSTNPAAEYGSGSGGQILTILKSGTNRYHGSVYDYLQNWQQDANTFGNKRKPAGTAPTERGHYTQQTFGATFGGPILHDKLFFFVDYMGYRKPSSSQSLVSVAPAAFRQGDFSVLLSPAYVARTGTAKQLYNSQANFAPFAGNRNIPINNPVARYLFAHPEIYPLPNQPSTEADGVKFNYLPPAVKSLARNDQGDVKIDYRIGQNDSIFARVSIGRANSGPRGTSIATQFPTVQDFPFTSAMADWTHVFSSSIVNDFRGGFTRIAYNSYNADLGGAFGNSGNSTVGVALPGAQVVPGFTQQSMVGSEQTTSNQVTALGTNGPGRLALDNNIEYNDQLSIQHGRHLFKIGGQLVWYQNNFIPNTYGALGNFNYNGVFTGRPSAGISEGYDFADFVMGYASGASISIGATGRVGQRQLRSAAYFQDDFKVTPNFTLNLGLRYEYDQPTYEVKNRIANVDLNTGQLLLAGVNGNGRSLYSPTYRQLDPRFGFAWSLKPRLVLRGGFASTTFMDFNGLLNHSANPPFSAQASLTASAPTTTAAGTPLNPATALQNVNAGPSTSYTAWSPRLRPAFVPSFDLTVEYQLSNTQSLMVAYVGNVGSALLNMRVGNQWTRYNDATSAPYRNLVGSSGTVTIFESQANQNYNAGEVVYRKRASHGITFNANYTFAKNLTNATGLALPSNIAGYSNVPQNSYDLRSEYGPAGYDIRHMFTSSFVAELPFGRGRDFANQMPRVLDLVIGGWKVSGNATLYSGFPVTIQASNAFGGNQGTGRANHYRKLVIKNRTTTNWWGTDPSAQQCFGADNGVCAYGAALPGTFGTSGVGTERSAGFVGVDAAGMKDFTFYKEHKLQFRADAYNVGNISSYNNPGRTVTATTGWGLIQSTRSQQRQIQFALKYLF
ncbi:outer membrane receptor for ferrienterochelin and colicins [Terriglobus roseus DSM 18391]|uniref:Outer membrane receptor for ferrienterochelin and colicins n=1 Tax=Terriglobus roseus (strain DSM 18391 / NRRL B-41598 / KBS 63) TaxID=926566 RepID=I3ZE01_TERRK|nr:outer membrane receptor for ferrienterochelin and colicins [Terriglobus roseus DSM 18391]